VIETWTAEQLSSWWKSEAESVQADLIVESSVTYRPQVRNETNDRFWLNLPLFLLGGPACYFVNDRSYSVDASIRSYFYDVRALASNERILLGDRQAQVREYQAEFTGVDLDFIDRARGGFGSYALSLVCPAGLLSSDSESALTKVEEAVVRGLASGLRRRIQHDPEGLVRPNRVSFFLLPGDLGVTGRGDGSVEVAGNIYFQRNTNVEGLSHMVILSAGKLLGQVNFTRNLRAEQDVSDTVRVYSVDEVLPNVGLVDIVQVEIFHAGSDARSRSFTLPVKQRGAVGSATSTAP
jgi:hypothetical protein